MKVVITKARVCATRKGTIPSSVGQLSSILSLHFRSNLLNGIHLMRVVTQCERSDARLLVADHFTLYIIVCKRACFH